MPDALTDIARDEERDWVYGRLVLLIRQYLFDSTNETLKQEIITHAKSVDGVPSGYWGGRTNFEKTIGEQLHKLVERDKRVWLKFLRGWWSDNDSIQHFVYGEPFLSPAEKEERESLRKYAEEMLEHKTYYEFRNLAPIPKRSLLFFTASCGPQNHIHTVSQELFALFRKKLAELHWRLSEVSDEYAIVVSGLREQDIEIVWLGNTSFDLSLKSGPELSGS